MLKDSLKNPQDDFFYHEMMTHPALFTHPHPQKILVIGHNTGILHEVLKHPSVSHIDYVTAEEFTEKHDNSRIQWHLADADKWLAKQGQAFDVIIQTKLVADMLNADYQLYHHTLSPEGIFIQPCLSFLLHLDMLKPLCQQIKNAGFHDWQMLNFPQPSYPTGLRSAMMATKRPIFKHLQEKIIFNRPFVTRYYNYDVHKAALVLPEFVREELEGLTVSY